MQICINIMQKTEMWSNEVKKLISDLHANLTLSDKDWHKSKNNKYKRASELLASALSQIANNGKPEDIEKLIEQSLLWLREEVKDPGCPSH